jgi:hypothetical protein
VKANFSILQNSSGPPQGPEWEAVSFSWSQEDAMQSINDLYSSVYLTAIGMNTRRHYDDPFDDLDGERPMPKSLFARIKSHFFLAISKIRKLSLKPEQDLLADRELWT